MRIFSPNKEQMEGMREIWDDTLIEQVNNGEYPAHAFVDEEENELVAIYALSVNSKMINVVSYFCNPKYEDMFGTHAMVIDDILNVAQGTGMYSVIVPDDAFGYRALKEYLEDFGFSKEKVSSKLSASVDKVVSSIYKGKTPAGVKSLSEASGKEKKAIRKIVNEELEADIRSNDLEIGYDNECSSVLVKNDEVIGFALCSNKGDYVYLDYLYIAKKNQAAGMEMLGVSANKVLKKYGKKTKFEALLATDESEKLAKKLMPGGKYTNFGLYRWDIA